MEEMSLSKRIAARAIAALGRSPGPANRAAFLSVRDDVQRAIDDGWSVLSIYKALRDEGAVSFGYQAFRRYVRALVVCNEQIEAAVQDKPTAKPVRNA
ncbi:TraK family protein [Paraburkholderia dipogonis]|uniref:TraK family protein n=1 Tax=Paraburkholderia dipogonis TaxID=1211383 RepID=A0ABW9B0I9_9BURK